MAKINFNDVVSALLEHYKKDLLYIEEYSAFFFWRDGWYEELKKRKLKRIISDFIMENFPDNIVNKVTLENIIEMMSINCFREVKDGEKIGGYISFNNCLLNTSTFEILEKDRKHICLNNIEYDYNENFDEESIPVFKKFLETSLVKEDDTTKPDPELINIVQEMMGYFLMDENKNGTAFFLVGDGSNGKSTLIKVVEKIIGTKFISNMTIQALTTNIFNPPALIGKRLNISSEESSKFLDDSMFKALITGDRISGQRKYGDVINFTPTAKFLFATNKLPTFKDVTWALKRRIQTIPFNRIIKDHEQDKELNEKLEKEIAGIIAWSIIGAKRLKANKFIFSSSEFVKNTMIEFENETSASLRFVRENYNIDDTAFISNEDLYEAYKVWNTKTGRNSKNRDNFLTDISKNIEGMKTVRRRDGGEQIRGKNLILKSATSDDDSGIDIDSIDFNNKNNFDDDDEN